MDATGNDYVIGGTDSSNFPVTAGAYPNSINVKSRGKIPVAILSSATFSAPTDVAPRPLTFGRTGDETSLAIAGSDSARTVP